MTRQQFDTDGNHELMGSFGKALRKMDLGLTRNK